MRHCFRQTKFSSHHVWLYAVYNARVLFATQTDGRFISIRSIHALEKFQVAFFAPSLKLGCWTHFVTRARDVPFRRRFV